MKPDCPKIWERVARADSIHGSANWRRVPGLTLRICDARDESCTEYSVVAGGLAASPAGLTAGFFSTVSHPLTTQSEKF